MSRPARTPIERADLRLGFVSDRSCFIESDVAEADAVWVNSGVGRLCEALARRCANLTAALSRAPRRLAAHEMPLDRTRVTLVPMPWVSGIAGGFFQARSARKVLREVEAACDALIVQMPFAAVGALADPQSPRVYHVCADVRSIVKQSDRYRGLRRLAAEGLAGHLDRRQAGLIAGRGARLVANGRDLLRRYGADRGEAVVSSTLLAEEVGSLRRERPADAPWRVLFVGFLRHEKGIDVLLEAFQRLLVDRPDAELEIIGAVDVHDHGVGSQIQAAVGRIGHRGTVRMQGHLPFGPQLFRRYAEADVCVVPSRSEGTPRVLVEARAFGCPVVASRVGGIPTSIEDETDGLLVPPGDADALYRALLRLSGDTDLRRRLIQAGFERARRTTVDHLADVLTTEAVRAVQQFSASGVVRAVGTSQIL